MKIFVSIQESETRDTFITLRALKKLQEVGEVTLCSGTKPLSEEELVDQAYDADVIVCCWGTVKFTKELIKRLPNLKIIAYTAGAMGGVVDPDIIDTGVQALTGNYMFAKSVAEGCAGYILCSLRRMERYMKQTRETGWFADWENKGLYGKRVGLVGFGEIAKALVPILQSFHTEIWVNSGHMTEEEATSYGVKRASREELFSECDIISLHLALNEKNLACIDRRLLSLIKPEALLVNTARARVVDEEALIDLLKENRFTAMLDVHYAEPIPKDHPFLTLENVMLMPHMGGPTIDMREQITMAFADDLQAFKEGKPMKNLFDFDGLSHGTTISI